MWWKIDSLRLIFQPWDPTATSHHRFFFPGSDYQAKRGSFLGITPLVNEPTQSGDEAYVIGADDGGWWLVVDGAVDFMADTRYRIIGRLPQLCTHWLPGELASLLVHRGNLLSKDGKLARLTGPATLRTDATSVRNLWRM